MLVWTRGQLSTQSGVLPASISWIASAQNRTSHPHAGGSGASWIELERELAEDLLLVDPGRTRRALGQLRTLGVRLALDHYGRSAPSFTRYPL